MLSRFLIILLAGTFLYNNIAKVILLSVKQSQIKSEARRSIEEKKLNEGEITLVKVPAKMEANEINWEEEDEFTYKGEWYDLVEKKIIKDSLYLYAKNDSAELELIAEIKEYINEVLLLNQGESKNTKNSVVFKSGSLDIFCEESFLNIHPVSYRIHIHKSVPQSVAFFRNIVSEIFIPPPENHFITA